MREIQAAGKKLKGPSAPSPGLTQVDHHCPHCGDVSSAPLTNLAEGPLGLWCCESCNQGFAVSVEMNAVDEPSTPRTAPRESLGDAAHSDDGQAKNQQDVKDILLALHGEQLLLQGRLAEIAEEVQRLESDHQ